MHSHFHLVSLFLVHNAVCQNLTQVPITDDEWVPLTQDEAIVTGVFFTIFLLAFIVSWAALIHYRKGYHVSGRMPPLIWGMTIALFAWVIYCFSGLLVLAPCLVTRLSVWFVYVIFGFFWVRMVRLVFQWEISTKLNEFNSLPSIEKTNEELYRGRGGFFVKYRKWITPRYLFFVLFVYVFVHFFLALESGFTSCPVPKDCDFGCYLALTRYIILFFVEITTVIIIFCRFIPKANDALMIRRELLWGVTFDLIFAVIGIALYFVISASAIVIYISAGFTIVACFIVWFPIYLDFRMARKHEEIPPEFNLVTILQDPEGFKSVASFLKSEFSAENAYFYQRVEEYRGLRNEGAAAYLYETFIASNSPFQVNISAAVASSIAKSLNKTGVSDRRTVSVFAKPQGRLHRSLSASSLEMQGIQQLEANVNLSDEELMSLFDTAQTEVLHLMERDSWVRYLQSSQFTDYSRNYLKDAHKLADSAEQRVQKSNDSSNDSSSRRVSRLSTPSTPSNRGG